MLRRISLSFAAQLASLAVSFADRILLVGILLRAWGTDLYSDWATLFAGAGLISFGELGLNVYFGNGWQSAFARGDEIRFQRLLGVSLYTYAVLGATLASLAVLFALTTDLARTFSLRALGEGEAAAVFLTFAAAVISRVMRGSISQLYRGRGRYAEGIIVDTLPAAMTVVLAAIAAAMGPGIALVALAYLGADLLFGWGVMVLDLRRRFPNLRFRPARPSQEEIRHIGANVRWLGLLQGAPVIWLQVPVLVIGTLGLSGPALVAFVVVRTLTNFARQIANMLSLSMAVEAASAHHLGETVSLGRTLTAYGGLLSGLAGAVAGGLVPLSAPVIALWTGNGALADPELLLWLLAPAVLVVPAMPLSALLTLVNVARPVALSSLAQIALGLGFCYGLGQRYGVAGVAAGLAIGEALAIGVLLPLLSGRAAGFAYGPYFLRCSALFVAASAWGAGAGFLLLELVGGEQFALLLLTISFWAILVLLPVALLSLQAPERSLLVNAPARWVRALRAGS